LQTGGKYGILYIASHLLQNKPETGKQGGTSVQNIDLICLGKLNAKYCADGVAEYQKRLAAFANFRIIELPEEKIEEKNASDAVIRRALDKEAKAILANVRKGAAIVALCVEGKQLSSEELADFLAQRAGSGAGDVAFVIGSSHGLADEVKRAAALRFSMGRITLPHQLARLVLTEQIYRACTINNGMKYHK
jgi:23S rRNA (pseudouridine1915-N3)-methyltransferase